MLSIPAVDTLRRVWKQDYLPQEKGGTWIADQDRLEAARLFFSPYDLDASAAKKRSTYWIGYKVHFTETCDEDRPRLITHVVTDIGPIPDRDELPAIHAALQHQDLLPHHHLVDAGYVDAEALVASQTEHRPRFPPCDPPEAALIGSEEAGWEAMTRIECLAPCVCGHGPGRVVVCCPDST